MAAVRDLATLLLLFLLRGALSSELEGALEADDTCSGTGCSLQMLQLRRQQLQGCSKAGKSCLHTKCCAEAGHTCYAKDRYWADCMSSCDVGIHTQDPPKSRTPWSCKVLGTAAAALKSKAVVAPTAPPKEAPASSSGAPRSIIPHGPRCSKNGEDCRKTGCCTEAGSECWEKNNYWASCQQSCPPEEAEAQDAESNETWTCARFIYNNRVPARSKKLRISKTGNLFEGHPYYVNPHVQTAMHGSFLNASAKGAAKKALKAMEEAPTAVWVDASSKISGTDPNTMEGALAQAASKETPELVTFILYNLPNRDCNANASSGQLCCNADCDFSAPGDCLHGLSRYVTEFIDPIAELLRRYADIVPVALVVEPDSLPNLATNLDQPRCGSSSTRAAYVEGVRYAVDAISRASGNVAIYLDAGNSGWLGWKEKMAAYVKVVQELGVAQKLRGFASNVANYYSLGVMCPTWNWCMNSSNVADACCRDPCNMLQEYNPGVNEHNYALHLVTAMSEAIPGFSPRVIIDTSRNGAANAGHTCQGWCNLRGAGAGLMATGRTANREVLDAYFWLKTPGESDGCTELLPDGERCPRFDAGCNSSHSLGAAAGESGAPEAGRWFDLEAEELAANSQLSQD